MKTHLLPTLGLCAFCVLILAGALGCQCSAPVPDPVVGSVLALHNQVWKGFDNEGLNLLEEKRDLYNGETLKVTSGGEAQINFNSRMIIHLYNNSTTNLITANPDPSTPMDIRMRLLDGGMVGIVKESGAGQAVFETPNGGEIYITGTEFFLFYEAQTQIMLAACFDGSVILQVKSGAMQKITPGTYAIYQPALDILSGDLPAGISLLDLMKEFTRGNMPEISQSWINNALQPVRPANIQINLISIDPEALVSGDCPDQPDTAMVTVEVFSAGGIESVWMEWELNGETFTVSMDQVQTATFQAALGPVGQSGTINLIIYATNSSGQRATLGPITIQVYACIG